MNSVAKTLAFWVALLATVVLLYNVFSRRSDGRVTEYSFSRFLAEVDHKNVKSARIVDSEVTGQLISGGSFRTIVPADYPALYDKLQGVDVKIEHATPNPWLSAFVSWAPFLFIVGFWIYFMRKFQKKGMLRNGDTDVPNVDQANVVHLDPDVASAFPNARSVNEALRLVIRLKDIPGTT